MSGEMAVVSVRSAAGGTREVPLRGLRAADFAGSVPWRLPWSRQGQKHLPGWYWSATTGGHVVYESRLELARLLLADFDQGVTGIWAQPCRLAARVDGRARWHVPDFLLEHADGTVTVVDVKPAGQLADPEVARALEWPRLLFEAHGWGAEVWPGADPVLVENVRFLAGYRRPGLVSAAALEDAWLAVSGPEPLGLAERRLAAGGPGWTVRPALLTLVWAGRLVTDLSRPLSGESVLRRAGS